MLLIGRRMCFLDTPNPYTVLVERTVIAEAIKKAPSHPLISINGEIGPPSSAETQVYASHMTRTVNIKERAWQRRNLCPPSMSTKTFFFLEQQDQTQLKGH